MTIRDSAIAYLVRPRVVHRLPGRLRIHIPLLRRVPPEHSGAVAFVARMLEVPEGIVSVSPCLTTANVLIRYDSDRISDDDILRFLRAVTQLAVKNRFFIQGLTLERLLASEDSLREWLTNTISQRLEFDSRSRIPDDVLA